jgi:hypothetical protein
MALYNVIVPGQLSRYSDELWAGQPGFDSQEGQEIFLFFSVQTGSGTHPASYTMGIRGSFPEDKSAMV